MSAPQLVDGQLAGHPVGLGVHALHETLGLVVLVGDLAHQLLQEILQRHQPRRAAELVDHDGQMEPLGLELLQQLIGPLGLRHEVRRMQVGAQVEVGRQPVARRAGGPWCRGCPR